MIFHKRLHLKLHNWRVFDNKNFILPSESFVLCDQNGSGKTSLLSAFYSLFTAQSWPGTKPVQHLKVGKMYFGVSTDYPDWMYNAKISPSGRMQVKYSKVQEEIDLIQNELWPNVLTYLPTDNYWFNLSRNQKLQILDDLLGQIFNQKYIEPKQKLDKLVKSKQNLIKHTQENEGGVDEVFLKTLNDSILTVSKQIWVFRREFFEYLESRLPLFQSKIESPLIDWGVRWEVSNIDSLKISLSLKKPTEISSFLEDLHDIDWQKLWQKELLSGKVLFGAQRDDFNIESNHLKVQDTLSRGEMRYLVLFIKYSGFLFMKDIDKNKLVFWLLDDVFNEFDKDREKYVIEEILSDLDYYIITSTNTGAEGVKKYSLESLTS